MEAPDRDGVVFIYHVERDHNSRHYFGTKAEALQYAKAMVKQEKGLVEVTLQMIEPPSKQAMLAVLNGNDREFMKLLAETTQFHTEWSSKE